MIPSTDELHKKGLEFYFAQNYKESIKQFDKAIKLDRNDYLAQNNIGKYRIV